MSRVHYQFMIVVMCVLCAMILVSGCGPRHPNIKLQTTETQGIREAGRDELLAMLDLQFGGLNSLQARASGVLVWEALDPNTRETTMPSLDLGRGDLLFRRTPDDPVGIRIVGGMQERTGGFISMLGRDENFWIRLPWYPGIVLTGSIDESVNRKKANSAIRPQDFSTLLFFDDILPLEADKRYIGYLETWPKIYILHILKTGRFPGEILHSRIWFDRSDLSVITHQLFDSDGSVIAEARFSDFTTVAIDDDAERESVMIPSNVFIFWPKDRVVLNMSIRPTQINRPIEDKVFQPPDPTRIQYRDIDSKIETQ